MNDQEFNFYLLNIFQILLFFSIFTAMLAPGHQPIVVS